MVDDQTVMRWSLLAGNVSFSLPVRWSIATAAAAEAESGRMTDRGPLPTDSRKLMAPQNVLPKGRGF